MDLFDRQAKKEGPLADRLRPTRLVDVVGQRHLLGSGQLLARLIRADRTPSMVLWGPPGTGKTTLAQVIAHETSATFVPFSAVLGGVPALRKEIAAAKDRRRMGRRSLLFVDEIHRFNKAQQDALLPHVEDGTVTLIGATTENPSFAVNAALLSRARVFRLESLSEEDVQAVLRRALTHPDGLRVEITDEAVEALSVAARGDARRALTVLEALAADGRVVDLALVADAFEAKTLLYDKAGEEHYNVVSAFIKSMRGSDPDAALYWMMRMLEAGDDPRFVLRRMMIFASEDIGNADPRALTVAVAADQAFQRLGMPEAMHAMAQCCTYLAVAPKSNAAYKGFLAARADVQEHGALPVPLKLRNAPTKAMKAWGYGDGYRYPHDEGGVAGGETYLPEKLVGARYYVPTQSGLEARIRDRLRRIRGEVDENSDPPQE
ncbi:MAG: replication-associated recombination protein A [Myxococcota bacterium]